MSSAAAWINAHRKFLIAVVGAIGVVAAELPPDAPGWLTGTISAVTAIGVWWVRNQPPDTLPPPRVHVEDKGYPRHPDPKPGAFETEQERLAERARMQRRHPRVDRRGIDRERPGDL